MTLETVSKHLQVMKKKEEEKEKKMKMKMKKKKKYHQHSQNLEKAWESVKA